MMPTIRTSARARPEAPERLAAKQNKPPAVRPELDQSRLRKHTAAVERQSVIWKQ
jgi:hypothetical protein